MIINIGHPRDSQELEKALSATLGEVFAHVAREPIQSLNSLVIASDSQLSAEALREAPVRAGAAAAGGAERGPARRRAAGRARLHRRQGAGRVADRRLDRAVRGGGDRMSAAAVSPKREAWGFAEVVVFVAGISTLGAEIAAARLVAPAFGASTVVWANTIAVVLVALADRLLRRRPLRRPAPARARAGAGGAARRGADRADPAAGDPAAGRDRGLAGRVLGLAAGAARARAPAGDRPGRAVAVGDPAADEVASPPPATSPGGCTRSAPPAASSATSRPRSR